MRQVQSLVLCSALNLGSDSTSTAPLSLVPGSFTRIFRIAAILVLLGCLVMRTGGTVLRAEGGPPISSTLKNFLSSKSRWEFPGNPLHDVLNFIETLHRIEIKLDEKAMQQAKISPGTLVHAIGTGTGDQLLTAVLGPVDLTWKAEGKTIRIYPQDRARRRVQEARASVALKKKLSQVGGYDFSEKSLEEVIDSLTTLHDVPILIDQVSFETSGRTPEHQLQGTGFSTLREALNELLDPAELDWECRGDRIIIKAKGAKADLQELGSCASCREELIGYRRI